MRILLSNDDGVYAEGIQILAQELRKLFDVVVVAPENNRSGASSALTLTGPLCPVLLPNGDYLVNGTPADCVFLALNSFLSGKIDLVISGINAGCNLGDDTIYSGTVAAALGGRHLGLPSIAVSLNGRQHYPTAARVVSDLVPRIYTDMIGKREILNINVPDVEYEELKGLQITRLGYRAAAEDLMKHVDPRNREVYWLGLGGLPEDCSEGTDFHAIQNNYVSITPISSDMTAHNSIDRLKSWLVTE